MCFVVYVLVFVILVLLYWRPRGSIAYSTLQLGPTLCPLLTALLLVPRLPVRLLARGITIHLTFAPRALKKLHFVGRLSARRAVSRPHISLALFETTIFSKPSDRRRKLPRAQRLMAALQKVVNKVPRTALPIHVETVPPRLHVGIDGHRLVPDATNLPSCK